VVEEFLGGRECLGLPAFTPGQQFQRFAHRDVIVDNEHDGRNIRQGSTPFLANMRRLNLDLNADERLMTPQW
jgi:hypothetical protein